MRLAESISRRALAPLLAAAVLRGPVTLPALAAESLPLVTYTDKQYGVSFLLPSAWEKTENEVTGNRKLVAAADPSDSDFNVFIAFTPIRGDYTSLGSFGNIDFVATTILPQCASGSCSLAADGIEGRMVDQASVRGSYIFDYIIKQVGQPDRRLRTLFSVQTVEGRGQNLVTLTAQCPQERYAEVESTLRSVIDSFKYT